jgi:F-type H+-transporting ATPase subunit a
VNEIGAKVQELVESLHSKVVIGQTPNDFPFVLTNYLLFLFIAIGLALLFFYVASRGERGGLVPKGRITNMAEMLVEFVRDGIAVEIIGPDGRKYFPFIGTVFVFIVFNNILGLIPGAKPGTGTMGVTVAIALLVFITFNAVGIKEQGFFKYLKNLVPHGVPWWIAWLVWLLEVISLILRPFTLSIRLFANMFAGHIILGVFAILVEAATLPLIEHMSVQTVAGALPAIVWMILLISLYALEVLVAFIQAYVFTLLTTVYIGAAVNEH